MNVFAKPCHAVIGCLPRTGLLLPHLETQTTLSLIISWHPTISNVIFKAASENDFPGKDWTYIALYWITAFLIPLCEALEDISWFHHRSFEHMQIGARLRNCLIVTAKMLPSILQWCSTSSKLSRLRLSNWAAVFLVNWVVKHPWLEAAIFCLRCTYQMSPPENDRSSVSLDGTCAMLRDNIDILVHMLNSFSFRAFLMKLLTGLHWCNFTWSFRHTTFCSCRFHDNLLRGICSVKQFRKSHAHLSPLSGINANANRPCQYGEVVFGERF